MKRKKSVLAVLLAMIMVASIPTLAFSEEYRIQAPDGKFYNSWSEYVETLRSYWVKKNGKVVGTITGSNPTFKIKLAKGQEIDFGTDSGDFSTDIYYNGSLQGTYDDGFSMYYRASARTDEVTFIYKQGALYLFDSGFSANNKSDTTKETSNYEDGFNPEFYAAANPDVVKAVGNDPEVLYKHYTKFGKAEGRKPHV